MVRTIKEELEQESNFLLHIWSFLTSLPDPPLGFWWFQDSVESPYWLLFVLCKIIIIIITLHRRLRCLSLVLGLPQGFRHIFPPRGPATLTCLKCNSENAIHKTETRGQRICLSLWWAIERLVSYLNQLLGQLLEEDLSHTCPRSWRALSTRWVKEEDEKLEIKEPLDSQ